MTTKPNSPLSVDKMLLCGIGAIIIVLLIVLILKNPPPPYEKDTPLSDGKTATREELVKEGAKPTKPQTVGDEKRCKEVAQAGKTYKTRVTAEVAGRAEDKAWGIKTVVNITYASEALVNRTIEENDGRTLVVLYEFEKIATLKALSEIESIKFFLEKHHWGILAVAVEGVVLGAGGGPGAGKTLFMGVQAAEFIGKYFAQSHLDNQMKAVAKIDALSGKKVRVVYVDGQGIVEMTPIGCFLTKNEQQYILDFAPLGDFNIMPNTEIAENAKWEVDAASLHAMIDPSLEGRPSGSITIRRGQNLNENGKSVSKLDIVTGDIMLDSSDAKTGRMARFAPAGTMEYNITDGYVRAAILSGQLHVEQFSKDHLLFETRFKTTPSITMTYSCNMVP